MPFMIRIVLLTMCLAVAGLGIMNCGGGACQTPNPSYDSSDPASQACLDVPGASGDPAAGFTVIGASFTLSSPPQDDTVQVASTEGGGGGVLEVKPGDPVKISVPFSAPNGNVTGVGVQFGNGPIQVVNVPGASGQTSGTMDVDVEIPDSICNNLSQICHDIKCYEFAVTEAGSVSAANINSIALKCGNCDEPSCQSLLTSCEEDECGGACSDGEVCLDGQCQAKSTSNSCELREACCPGQDNSCNPPDASCYCDEACQDLGDCCPDACNFCGYCGGTTT